LTLGRGRKNAGGVCCSFVAAGKGGGTAFFVGAFVLECDYECQNCDFYFNSDCDDILCAFLD
jgi:hypothetical protein